MLASDFSKLGDEVGRGGGRRRLDPSRRHGRILVPNITFGPPVIKAIRNRTKAFFDVI